MFDEYVVFFLISKSFIMVLIKCLLIENQQLVKIKILIFYGFNIYNVIDFNFENNINCLLNI